MIDTIICDQVEKIFVSCLSGIVVGLVVFGGMCVCVFKKRYCCF